MSTMESGPSPEVEQAARKHPDALVNEIIRIQEALPYEERLDLMNRGGGGDITITVQDDMPLVEVRQGNYLLGIGATMQDALEIAVQYHTDPEVKRTVDEMSPLNLVAEA